jgi:acyl carrier protein
MSTTNMAGAEPAILINELRTFVVENFLFGQEGANLREDTSFMGAGVLDSTGVLELIGFLERTYDLRLTDDELVPENLDSLQRLATFVSRKLHQRPEVEAAATFIS